MKRLKLTIQDAVYSGDYPQNYTINGQTVILRWDKINKVYATESLSDAEFNELLQSVIDSEMFVPGALSLSEEVPGAISQEMPPVPSSEPKPKKNRKIK